MLLLAVFGGSGAESGGDGAFPLPTPGGRSSPLRVVVDTGFPPLAFPGEGPHPRGVLVDQWELWTRRTGVPVVFVPREGDEARRALLRGEGDVLDPAVPTPGVPREWDLGPPVGEMLHAIFFDRKLSGIRDAASLRGLRVGILRGAAVGDTLRRQGVQDLVAYPDLDAMIRAAASGDLRVFVGEIRSTRYTLLHRDVLGHFRQTGPIFRQSHHRAVRRGDRETRGLIEAGFGAIPADALEEIAGRWEGYLLGSLPWQEETLGGLGIAAVLALGLLGWNALLARAVRRQTEALQRQMAQGSLREDALRRSEERFRLVVEHQHDLILRFDGDGRISFASPSFCTLVGLPEGGILGRPFLDFVHPQDHLWTLADFRALAVPPHRHQAERRLRDRKRSWRWIAWSIQGIRDPDDHPIAAVGVGRDVTERREAETALRESEERYRAIVEQTQDGIFLVQNGGIFFANEQLGRLFDRAPEHLATLDALIGMVHPDDREGCRNYLKRREAARPTPGHHEIRGGRQEALRDLEIVATPVRIHEQKALLVVVRDITDKKRSEERLRYLTFHDPLTGLANRTRFEEELHRRDQLPRGRPGLLVMDVDGLKLVNDTFGHERGDALLALVAELLRRALPHVPVLARIGGDEFAALGDDLGEDELLAMGHRIREVFGAARLACGEVRIPVQLALGHALAPEEGIPMRDLFRIADDRMYRDKLHRRSSTRGTLVQILKSMLAERDFLTEGHGERLAHRARDMAQNLALDETALGDLTLFAQFHDIGKVGIPDAILRKPGPLTPEERTIMQQHAEIGQRIAQSSPDLQPLAEWILLHHERWDGTGYPLGIAGERIPLPCRILAVIDAYDAMTSDRPYRKALPPAQAREELRRGAGTQFDPDLVARFLLLEAPDPRKENPDPTPARGGPIPPGPGSLLRTESSPPRPRGPLGLPGTPP